MLHKYNENLKYIEFKEIVINNLIYTHREVETKKKRLLDYRIDI